jgi:hypothetical protein
MRLRFGYPEDTDFVQEDPRRLAERLTGVSADRLARLDETLGFDTARARPETIPPRDWQADEVDAVEPLADVIFGATPKP